MLVQISIWGFLELEHLVFLNIQVYRGRTLDGINVAVKVQRPNMLHVVARDVYILRLGVCIVFQ